MSEKGGPPASGPESDREDARRVQRLAPAQGSDLVAATGPVGDHDRVVAGLADSRHQAVLGHGNGDVVVLGLEPEGARVPA